MKKVLVGVVGATSLTAEVLLKLLIRHPKVEIKLLCSESKSGTKASQHYQFLQGNFSGNFQNYKEETVLKETDLVFLAKQHGEFLPNTISLFNQAKKLNRKFKIIDLSADFRLKNPEDYKEWYKFKHQGKGMLREAVYGLPELYRTKIKKAVLYE